MFQFIEALCVIEINCFFDKFPQKKSGRVRSGDHDGQWPTHHFARTDHKYFCGDHAGVS
jgi:hypothetical protein